MPLLRSPSGAVVNIPDEEAGSARAQGYADVSLAEAAQTTAAPEIDDRGALGAVNAAATGALSGATLGLSDYALKGLLGRGEFERLRDEREAHPVASGIGQVAGAVFPAFGGPTALLARTPAGALSRAVAPLAERGASGVLAAGAIEGAVQNAGAYLADTALGDRELSAEGVFGALGAGGAFGIAGGAAALGIERGTIAARRMFSRVGGTEKAALEAEQAWKAAHQSTVEANDAAADLAKAKLAEARAAREQAQLAKQRAGLRVAETEQGAPGIDAAYRKAEVEREQIRDAAKQAYEATPVAPAAQGPVLTPQTREGLYGLGLTDADIAAMSPADLAEATRLVQSADAELASMTAARPLSPTVESDLAQAVAEHDAARIELDDLLRRIEAPTIEPGVASGVRVPRGQFDDLAQRGPLAQGTPVQVTTVGKKLGEGTPADVTSLLEPGSVPAFDPKSRTYHDPGAPWRKAEEFAPSEPATGVFGKPAPEDDLLAQLGATKQRVDAGEGLGAIAGRDIVRDQPTGLEGLVRAQREAGPTGLEDLVRIQREAAPPVEPAIPSGFDASLKSDGTELFSSPTPAVHQGVPTFKELKRATYRDNAYVVRPSELADRNVTGIRTGDDMLKDARTSSVRDGWGSGKSMPAIEIDVAKNGKYEIADGNHRLIAAALDGDRPVLVRFRPVEGKIGGMDSVSDELREALKQRAPAKATAADQFSPGKNGVIPVLENPTDEAADFLIRRVREQGVKFSAADGPASVDKTFLGSLGVDWSIPQHKKTLMALLRDGKVQLSRADLSGAMDRAMLRASEIEDAGLGGRFKSSFHFISDDGRKLAPLASKAEPAAAAPLSDLESALQGTASKLNEGRTLGQIGAESPARAEYVAQKAAKREADAAFFRDRADRAPDTGELEQLLRATKSKLGGAEHLGDIAGPRGHMHPLAVAKLEQDLDAAVQRAATATEPAAVAAAEQEVRVIEEQLSKVGARPGAVEDVASAAEVITKYERSAAKLTEALGPDAPPAAQEAAKAFRAAEDAADRKVLDRTTRAIDDGVDSQGRPRTVLHMARKESEARMAAGQAAVEARQAAAAAPAAPGRPTWEELEAQYGKYAGQPDLPPTSKQALAAAKADNLAADTALKRAKVAETEAKIGSREAQDLAAQTRKTADAARPGPSAPPEQSTLGAIATTIGIAGEVGIPGVPHPKDIPIIGPLLSLYLKYKALKYATGRFVGRVSATGDTRAAALAARTKEKIATAVDRTLGLAETAARKARPAAVATAVVLGHRIFDDGEPDAPKNASAQELAAVRIREIATAATRPDLVSAYVRKEMRGVVDPDLLEAAEKHLIARFQYLNRVMPKAPPPNPFSKREWKPSPAAAHEVAQRLEVVYDPASAFVNTTPAKADTLKNTSPRLLRMAQERLIERIGDAKHPVDYHSRLRGSLLFSVPLDDSMRPEHAAILATAHAPSPVTDAVAPQAGPPQASIAANTNLSSVYRTGTERRAL